MVETCAGGTQMGYLFRDPQEIMDAFVKDYFPHMSTKTRAAK